MNVSNKLSAAMAGAGFALLQVAIFPAHAGDTQQSGLQVFDPSGVCASWTWGGTPAAPTLTCNAGAPPPPGVPAGCSLIATPSTLPAGGGTVSLNASCSSNTDGTTTWAWTGAGAQSATSGATPSIQAGVQVTQTTTFGVVATTNGQSSSNKSATVTVGAPPPPPPTGSIQCSGFAKTIVIDQPWAAGATTTQGFDGSTAVVVRFTVPAGQGTSGSGRITASDSSVSASVKYATLTSDPCNFSVLSGDKQFRTSGPVSTVGFSFNVAGIQKLFKVLVQPGQTYYMNLRNTGAGGGNACPSGNCEAYIEFTTP